jgi:uncharacterized protein (TIGR02646 family)
MIRVHRGPEPEGFSDDAAEWLRQFYGQKATHQITANTFWSRVRKRRAMHRYAQHLYEAFQHKCAFCESKPEPTSSLQIEHYRPKSNTQFEDRMFDWGNWLSSCGRCNSNKWKHFPDCGGQPCLIDPTSEDPADHIEFLRADALGKTSRGEKTIELLGLERSPLKDERSTWLSTMDSLLLLCLVPESSVPARQFLIWAMQPDAPYSAMTYCYLKIWVPNLADPVTPHPRVDFDEPRQHIAELVEKHKDHLAQLI